MTIDGGYHCPLDYAVVHLYSSSVPSTPPQPPLDSDGLSRGTKNNVTRSPHGNFFSESRTFINLVTCEGYEDTIDIMWENQKLLKKRVLCPPLAPSCYHAPCLSNFSQTGWKRNWMTKNIHITQIKDLIKSYFYSPEKCGWAPRSVFQHVHVPGQNRAHQLYPPPIQHHCPKAKIKDQGEENIIFYSFNYITPSALENEKT